MVHVDGPVGLDGVGVCFDDQRAVADAGIVLAATLADRLGIEALVEHSVELGGRPGAANAGAKVMTLVSAMALGADCIDDCDLLRAGRTGQVLGHDVLAPSTLGTFLRSFTFGHVRQLDRVLGLTLERAWAAGAGPGDGRLVVDVDSFVGEVHGYAKQGASFGYTRQRGYHPLLATRAGTGEVLHIRCRTGSANTSRGMLRFCDELIARVERAGAKGPKLLRADSGFWAKKTFARLEKGGLAVLDRGAHAAPRPHSDRPDRRGRMGHFGRLPRHKRRPDRRNHVGRPAPDRAPRAHPRRPGRTAAQLGALPVRDQPRRGARSR